MTFLERLQNVAISISTSGDNTIIAAPGDGHYLAIDFLQVLVPVAVGVTFKSNSTSKSGKYSFAAGQSTTVENSFQNQDGVITCGNNEAFVINLDGAQQCSGFARYRIIGE